MAPGADVPSTVNFHDAMEAHKWANEALAKRPARLHMFRRFAAELNELPVPPRTVLELGSGPGFLAEQILSQCPTVETYYLLDFSGPMHALSQSRLRSYEPRTQFLHADFKSSAWTYAIPTTPDVVVAMESVHELRHKSHAPRLYREIASILAPRGALFVCDHLPKDQMEREQALYMEAHEQMTALAMAGFHERGVRAMQIGLALYRAQFGGFAESEVVDGEAAGI